MYLKSPEITFHLYSLIKSSRIRLFREREARIDSTIEIKFSTLLHTYNRWNLKEFESRKIVLKSSKIERSINYSLIKSRWIKRNQDYIFNVLFWKREGNFFWAHLKDSFVSIRLNSLEILPRIEIKFSNGEIFEKEFENVCREWKGNFPEKNRDPHLESSWIAFHLLTLN